MNKTLLILGVYIFLYESVFSLRYSVHVINYSGSEICLSKDSNRDIAIIGGLGEKYSFPEELKLAPQKSMTISVDARPYNTDERQEDAVYVRYEGKEVKCHFKVVPGDTYVYPFLENLVADCELKKDVYGPDYTLTIGKTPKENVEIISEESLTQQGATHLPQEKYLPNPDFEGIF